jgi:predicted Zn-dependent protease
LYLKKGELKKAQLHSKKSIQLAPENPSVIDTRGMVLFKIGKKLAAWKALSKAYEISDGQDMSIALNYAEVLIANNLNKEAIALLQQSATNNNEFSQRKISLMTRAKKY